MKHWTHCAWVAGLALAASSAWGADLNKPAPPFSILTFDKQTVQSTDLKGKVVVINYWATWCTPCRAEMIAFDSYIRTHPGADLKVYSIATENSVPAYKLERLASALSFPLARRLSGHGYGVMRAVPTSYVIDRAGVIRYASAGAIDEQSFGDLVTRLLAEPAPDAQTAAATTAGRP
jgi:peroxiredoxin